MSAPPERSAWGSRDLAAQLDDGQFGWLVTFSDLVLQLFAFVVVAVAAGGALHRDAVAPADVAAAEPPSLAISVPPPASDAEIAGATTGVPAASREEAQPSAPVARSDAAEADAARRRMSALGSYVGELVAATAPPGAIDVRAEAEEVRIAFDGIAGFAPGSAELSPAMLPVLGSLREVVAEHADLEVHVAGHTDDVPIHTAQYASNLDLSLARALAVARALGSAELDVGRRIVASGFAERRPVASNAETTGRSQNRRVEVRLVAVTASGEGAREGATSPRAEVASVAAP